MLDFSAMMEWNRLLSHKRIREIDGGRTSGVNDHRTPFQSDFDRVIFCAPVKRLQDKSQVFPLEPNDAVRTRLTHSLEVSCVARGMGQWVGRKLNEQHPDRVTVDNARAIEDICGTAGLIHDLGNPPFGHYGEDAISSWFALPTGQAALIPLAEVPSLRDDFARYEGNARTLRLLCHLQVLSDQYGLNLTVATLAATMKYVVPSHQADKKAENHAHRKPGHCYSESHFVELIRRATGIDKARHPLAYLVEAADDCVYSICDLEDGVKKRILSFEAVRIALIAAAKELGLDDSLIGKVIDESKAGVDVGVAAGPKLTGWAHDEAYMQMFRVNAIGRIVKTVCQAFLNSYDAIMSGTYMGELVNDKYAPEARTIVMAAKKVGKEQIYCTRPTVELELRGGHIIQSLLDRLWIGIDPSSRKTPTGKRYFDLISKNYCNVNDFERNASLQALPKDLTRDQLERYYDLMLLTDYVGGMTDSFASNLYASLTHG